MATKDITDRQVCEAYRDATALNDALVRFAGLDEMQRSIYPYDLLADRTGQPWKVIGRAIDRAEDRGLFEYGVTQRTGWLTDCGLALLALPDATSGLDPRVWPERAAALNRKPVPPMPMRVTVLRDGVEHEATPEEYAMVERSGLRADWIRLSTSGDVELVGPDCARINLDVEILPLDPEPFPTQYGCF